jgi:outer membrane protein OmpU
MNNFKKIGMSALAASLVSTSAFAGELTATGSAALTVEGYSGTGLQSDTAYSMADSVILSGSTELDNGMTVTMSFELDGDSETPVSGISPYDNNSLTIASDALGTLTFHAHGGDSATGAIDATAAGDIFDNFDGAAYIGATGVAVQASAGGDNSLFYTSPSFEGIQVTASYRPDSAVTAGDSTESSTGFGVNYTGVEGLSVHYAVTDIETGIAATTGEHTVMKASYAYGPVTVAYSSNENDEGLASNDQDTTSYNISYTVSESISIGYGQETIEKGGDPDDAEYSGVNASYTAGGMTISAKMIDAENVNHGTAATEDGEYWSLGLAFAF